MDWNLPQDEDFWRGIDTYMEVAYRKSPVSAAVRDRLDLLRKLSGSELYSSSVFEKDSAEAPARYALRLGNPFYPHMKFVVQRSPAGGAYLFRADAHDRHIRPAPGSSEAKAFAELVTKNQQLTEEIEEAWDKIGLPTFKGYLRRDLASRRVGH